MPGAKKFTLLGLMVGASAKKFALQAQNGRKTLFSGALGEFFRGNAGGGAVLGEFFLANRYCDGLVGAVRPPCLQWWGICTT